MSAGTSTFFITGGTMGQDTPSYIERRADADLYRGLRAGEFCYVLTPRQIGKSSLMVRTAARLRDEGHPVVTLDLTTVGQNLTLEQWYYGLLTLVGGQLNLRAELRRFWLEQSDLSPLQRFIAALREVVLPTRSALSVTPTSSRPQALTPSHPSLIVFIDEIDSVLSLPFSTDEFFVAVRECYNRRAEDPAMAGLTFCLLGVASPSDLIQDPLTTPFNVGRRVELHDFTPAEAAPLAIGLQLGTTGGPLRSPAVAERLLRRVLYWTDGHPYLTQRLCRAVAEEPAVRDRGGVDRVCRRLFLEPGARERDDNLYFVHERLVGLAGDEADYLGLYRKIRAGKKILPDDPDPRLPVLKLAGLVAERGGRMQVRNRIYHHVFDEAWVRTHGPAPAKPEKPHPFAALPRRRALGALAGGLALTTALAVGLVERDRKARLDAATLQLERGTRSLQEGDGQGLLALVDAYRLSTDDRPLQTAVQKVWSGWQATHGNRLEEVLAAGGPVASLAFSPEGETLAAATTDGRLRWWSTRTWQSGGTGRLAEGRASQLAFGPGGRLLAAAGERDIELWNAVTGRPGPTFRSPEPVRALAFLGGERFLVARTDRSVRLWDTPAQKPLPPLPGAGGAIFDTASTPAGGGIVAIVSERGVLLHRLAPRARPRRITLPGGDPVVTLAFSPDGNRLALASHRQVGFWDLRRGALEPARIASPEPIKGIRFSHDGQKLATRGSRVVRLWSSRSGAALGPPLPHGSELRTVVFRPDDEVLAAAEARVHFWKPDLGQTADEPLAEQGGMGFLAFDPRFRWVATAPGDELVRVWKTTARPTTRERIATPTSTTVAEFTPDGNALLTIDHFACRTWNPQTGQAADPPLDLHRSGGRAALSPDGARMASTADKTLHIWDRRGSRIGLPQPLLGRHCSLAFSPDGKRLAVGTNAPDVRVWSAETGQPLTPSLPLKEAPQHLLLSADGRFVVAGAWKRVEAYDLHRQRALPPFALDGGLAWIGMLPETSSLVMAAGNSLLRWDLSTPASRPDACPVPGKIRTAATDLTGQRLAVATAENRVHLYDLKRMRPEGPVLPHADRVHSLAFSPDGELLATGYAGNRVQLWNLRTGQASGAPFVQARDILRLLFRPDGQELAVHTDGAVELWAVPQRELSLDQMELSTWVSLDARRNTQGIEPIPAGEWRQMRDRLRRSKRGQGSG